MSDKKHTSRSHEEVDTYRNPPDAVDREEVGNNDPLEPDKDTELLFQLMSRLQSVRVPGKGRLTADEAIETAVEQGKAFRRWKENGSLVGEIEVWVEGERKMSVLPESPAKLQDFSFTVPSPDDAVLQLTTQADGEQVVLYTLPLRNVPPEGLNHTEWWPNGQHILLSIIRKLYAVAASGTQSVFSGSEKVEAFYIRVAVNPLREAARPAADEESSRRGVAIPGWGSDESSTPDDDSRQMRGMNAESSLLSKWRRLMFPLQPVAGFARAATVLALVLSMVMVGGEVRQDLISPSNNNLVPAQSLERLISSTTAPKITAPTVTVNKYGKPKPIEPKIESAFARRMRASGNCSKQNHATGSNELATTPRSGPGNESNESATVGVRMINQEKRELTPGVGCAFVAGTSSEDARRNTKTTFATVQAIYVRFERQPVPSKEAPESSATVTLVQGTERELKAWNEGDGARLAALIGLRTISDSTPLDAVYVDIRDQAGNTFWQGFVVSDGLPPEYQSAISGAATVRFVSGLKELLNLTMQRPDKNVVLVPAP